MVGACVVFLTPRLKPITSGSSLVAEAPKCCPSTRRGLNENVLVLRAPVEFDSWDSVRPSPVHPHTQPGACRHWDTG